MNLVYEALTDILKPKSEEEIKNIASKLFPAELLSKGIENRSEFLIKKALEGGIKIKTTNEANWISKILEIPLESLDPYIQSAALKLKLGMKVKASPNQLFAYYLDKYDDNGVLKAIKKGATNTNILNDEAIVLAVYKNNIALLRLLLKNKKNDPSTGGKAGLRYGSQVEWPIKHAARHGYSNIVKLLLTDTRVDGATNNNLPLRYAYKHEHWKTMLELIKDDNVLRSGGKIILKIMSELLKEKSN